jgi:hypothetical protein
MLMVISRDAKWQENYVQFNLNTRYEYADCFYSNYLSFNLNSPYWHTFLVFYARAHISGNHILRTAAWKVCLVLQNDGWNCVYANVENCQFVWRTFSSGTELVTMNISIKNRKCCCSCRDHWSWINDWMWMFFLFQFTSLY